MRSNEVATQAAGSEAAGDLMLRAAWLERFSSVSPRLMRAQWHDTLRLAAYARLSAQDARELLSSTRWVADVFATCLHEGRSFTRGELAELNRIGSQRAGQGIPLATVKERFRSGVIQSSAEFTRLAFASSGPRAGPLITALIIGEVMPLATTAEDALSVGYLANGGHAGLFAEPDDKKGFGLTPAERRVLTLLPGRTNKQLAAELGTHVETVKTQVSSILRKLGADDRAHAVAIAMANDPASAGAIGGSHGTGDS